MCAICWLKYGTNFLFHTHQQIISYRAVHNSCITLYIYIYIYIYYEGKRMAATVFIHVPILSNFKFIFRHISADTNS